MTVYLVIFFGLRMLRHTYISEASANFTLNVGSFRSWLTRPFDRKLAATWGDRLAALRNALKDNSGLKKRHALQVQSARTLIRKFGSVNTKLQTRVTMALC